MTKKPSPAFFASTGRASTFNPANRFERLYVEPLVPDDDDNIPGTIPTEFLMDSTKEILARNDSPDISFDYSLNPYRGCEHGCIYCYARPTHEYFGLSAGLDFESKILVKPKTAELLESKFLSKSWQPQLVAMSGNTDCYQPVEKQLKLTRECLKVFLKFRNPVGIVTKNALVTRDIDILRELAALQLTVVTVSVTTLDHKLARKMEPRASAPQKRLETLAALVQAGIPANINVAPLIPGLNDHEMPEILHAAADLGVKHAAYILLRLPHAVKALFQDWLVQNYPDRENKILNSVRDTRAGQLNDPCFRSRMSGEGMRATTIQRMFKIACRKYGMNEEEINLATHRFRRGNPKQEAFLF